MSTLPSMKDAQDAWDGAWRAFAASAHAHAAEVQEDWAKFAADVEKTVRCLIDVRPVLERLPGRIEEYEQLGGSRSDVATYRANYNLLVRTYNTLTAGVWQGAESAPPGTIQLGLAWFIVAGATLSILGVCFAIPAYKYAASLYEQAKAQEAEINGRIEAMRRGAKLQESTYQPPPPDPPTNSPLTALLLLMGLGGGVALAYYAKTKGKA